MTKSYGNLILMTLICVIIFWMFMALRPAQAGFWPGTGVHRCTWAISAGCAAWRARGGKPAPGRHIGQRKGW
jgi:hypothetical protein